MSLTALFCTSGVDAAGTGCGSSSGGGLSTWDALAATLPADIPSQPKMLQGGSLREYQLQVRGGCSLPLPSY